MAILNLRSELSSFSSRPINAPNRHQVHAEPRLASTKMGTMTVKVGHDVLDARAVGDDGACEKRHALWIDHLKGGGLHKGQRPARFVAVGPAGCADPPGQIAQEQDGRTLHQQMKLRDGGKKPGEAEAAGNGQATDARGDPQNMRKRTSESECRAGRGQHDVVRPWRERRCGSEDHKP